MADGVFVMNGLGDPTMLAVTPIDLTKFPSISDLRAEKERQSKSLPQSSPIELDDAFTQMIRKAAHPGQAASDVVGPNATGWKKWLPYAAVAVGGYVLFRMLRKS